MKKALFFTFIAILCFGTISAQKHAPLPPSVSRQVPGIYPEGSLRLLDYTDLEGLTPWDLKVMRNEIYARHGYIFKTKDMINYFAAQVWYRPRLAQVDNLMSATEKKNIAFIKKYE